MTWTPTLAGSVRWSSAGWPKDLSFIVRRLLAIAPKGFSQTLETIEGLKLAITYVSSWNVLRRSRA